MESKDSRRAARFLIGFASLGKVLHVAASVACAELRGPRSLMRCGLRKVGIECGGDGGGSHFSSRVRSAGKHCRNAAVRVRLLTGAGVQRTASRLLTLRMLRLEYQSAAFKVNLLESADAVNSPESNRDHLLFSCLELCIENDGRRTRSR